MFRTTMPKASIHKYCNFIFWKCNVWLAKNRMSASPPYHMISFQYFNKFSFGRCVSSRTYLTHNP